MSQNIPPTISEHNKPSDFEKLKPSRESESQTGYHSHATSNYVLLGWAKDGDPIFCDRGGRLWDKNGDYNDAVDNKGRKVTDILYWKCSEACEVKGGRHHMLPVNEAKINAQNMWLEKKGN